MNFKKTWKRGTEGFTLVELIVVIAILAILAGIAVPAYSGYIKKANKAADLQLLGAVNTAFAAAVLENGEDVNTVTRAQVILKGGEGAKAVDLERVSPYKEAFARYYAGNENSMFKVIEQLAFVNGVFVDAASAPGVNAVAFAGGTIYVTDAQLQALRDSSYDFDTLFTQIDGMTGAVALAGSEGAVLGFLDNEAYYSDMILALGGTLPGEDAEEGALTAEFTRVMNNVVDEAIAKELGVSVDKLDKNSAEYSNLYNTIGMNVVGNMPVLYAAQHASQQTTEGVMAIINANNPKGEITKQISSNPGGAFGDAALVYSAFTAYANAQNDATAKDLIANFDDDELGVFNALQSNEELRKNFQAYMNSPAGQTDLNAALSAMDMVSGSASDKNAMSDVLANGFSKNEGFMTMFDELMNGSNS